MRYITLTLHSTSFHKSHQFVAQNVFEPKLHCRACCVLGAFDCHCYIMFWQILHCGSHLLYKYNQSTLLPAITFSFSAHTHWSPILTGPMGKLVTLHVYCQNSEQQSWEILVQNSCLPCHQTSLSNQLPLFINKNHKSLPLQSVPRLMEFVCLASYSHYELPSNIRYKKVWVCNLRLF